jgi:hypothetical protein
VQNPADWPEDARALLHPRRSWAKPIPLKARVLWNTVRKRATKTKCEKAPLVERAAPRLASKAAPTELADRDTELAVAFVVADAYFVSMTAKWVFEGLDVVVDHWVATGGLTAATLLVLAFSECKGDLPGQARWAAWERLGWHLAAAGESEAASAETALREAAVASPLAEMHRAVITYLFPASGEADRTVMTTQGASRLGHDFARAVAAIDTTEALAHFQEHGRYDECRTSRMLAADFDPRRPTRYFQAGGSGIATCTTLVARFGDDAIDPLLAVAARTPTNSGLSLLHAFGNLGTERAFDLLVPGVRGKKELALLRTYALRAPLIAGPRLRAELAGPSKLNAAAFRDLLKEIDELS